MICEVLMKGLESAQVMTAKDERIGFRIPSEVKDALLQIAKKEGRSLAQVCELLLRGGIHEYEREGTRYLHRLVARPQEKDKKGTSRKRKTKDCPIFPTAPLSGIADTRLERLPQTRFRCSQAGAAKRNSVNPLISAAYESTDRRRRYLTTLRPIYDSPRKIPVRIHAK